VETTPSYVDFWVFVCFERFRRLGRLDASRPVVDFGQIERVQHGTKTERLLR
jgi:hypothetical protein